MTVWGGLPEGRHIGRFREFLKHLFWPCHRNKLSITRTAKKNYPLTLYLHTLNSKRFCMSLERLNCLTTYVRTLTTCKALEVCKEVALREDDMKYLRALSESYNNATSANVKLQILSIMADITTLQEIRKYIPRLTKYMFCQARQHSLVSGRGAPVIAKQSPRWRIDLNQLDHFLDFITSPFIVQDLPFGEQFLKLSTGEVVQAPNVIRVLVSRHIIDQYVQYCNEIEVKPLSNSTLRHILSSCQASTRSPYKVSITLFVRVARPWEPCWQWVRTYSAKPNYEVKGGKELR